MATGTVVRFDARRGYGFVQPDDGGADVFVHQNNITMDGFRYLQVGERVSYELEVGEKGMKAISVGLLEPRAARPARPPGMPEGNDRPQRGGDRGDRGDQGGHRYAPGRFGDRPQRGGDDDVAGQVERLRRKQERLISLLVEKGLLQPGEIDGVQGANGTQQTEG